MSEKKKEVNKARVPRDDQYLKLFAQEVPEIREEIIQKYAPTTNS